MGSCPGWVNGWVAVGSNIVEPLSWREVNLGIVRVMEKGDHVKGAIVRKMKKKTNLGFAAFCGHSIIKGWLLYILGSRTGGFYCGSGWINGIIASGRATSRWMGGRGRWAFSCRRLGKLRDGRYNWIGVFIIISSSKLSCLWWWGLVAGRPGVPCRRLRHDEEWICVSRCGGGSWDSWIWNIHPCTCNHVR